MPLQENTPARWESVPADLTARRQQAQQHLETLRTEKRRLALVATMGNEDARKRSQKLAAAINRLALEVEPVKKVARTLRAHRELILNYFRARKEFFSGVIEGLNNKAKVMMRKSYGFRTFRVTTVLALYHSLGKLPEPELTHRFF